MYNLFLQNEIICNKINNNIKQRITSPAYYISKSLPVYNPPKWSIKKVNQFNYKKLQGQWG